MNEYGALWNDRQGKPKHSERNVF